MKQDCFISSLGSKEKVILSFCTPRVSLVAPEGDRDIPEMQIYLETIQCSNCQEMVPKQLIEDHYTYCMPYECLLEIDQEALLRAFRNFVIFLESRNSPELSPLIQILSSLSNGRISNSLLKNIEAIPNNQSYKIQIYKEKAYSLCRQLLLFDTSKPKDKKLNGEKDVLKHANSNSETGQNFKAKENPVFSKVSEIKTVFITTGDLTNPSHLPEDELRRQFLALCVNAKIKLGLNIQAQEIDIERMYEEAKQYNIEPEMWGNYVQEYLVNIQNKEEVINRFSKNNSFD